jgi:hypothetical protein
MDQNDILIKSSVGTIPMSNSKILERGTIHTLNTQIHNRSLIWLDADTQ